MLRRTLWTGACLLCAGAWALDFAALPWLSHPAPGEVSVQFTGDVPCAGMLEYRFAGPGKWERLSNTLAGRFVRDRALHRFRLKGEPGASCTFCAVLIDREDRAKEVRSPEFTVVLPAKERKSYSFAFMSDFQFTPERCQELIGKYSLLTGMKECDFVVSGGDMSMSFDTVKEDILDKWLLPVRNAFPLLPMVPVRGNHEWRGTETTEEWTRMMHSQETGMPYYAFSYGPDFYIVLDSFEDKPDHYKNAEYTYFHESTEYRKAEREWLESVVKRPEFKRARYRIVFVHCAPYGSLDLPNNRYARELIAGLLDKNTSSERIHLLMGGHVHLFTRSMPGEEKVRLYKPHPKYFTYNAVSCGNVPFPVILQDGPGGNCNSSASRVNVSDAGIEVRTFVEDGTVIDHVRFKPDGSAEELVSPPAYEVLGKTIPLDK